VWEICLVAGQAAPLDSRKSRKAGSPLAANQEGASGEIRSIGHPVKETTCPRRTSPLPWNIPCHHRPADRVPRGGVVACVTDIRSGLAPRQPLGSGSEIHGGLPAIYFFIVEVPPFPQGDFPPTTRLPFDMNDSQILVYEEVGEILKAIQPPGTQTERRGTVRFPFSVVQAIAPYNGSQLPSKTAFRKVRCCDLSTAGVSFLLPQSPDFENVVVALGKPPQLIYVTARLANCRPAAGGFLVGCSLVAKVELSA
jgi:hypothetical protein